MLVIACLMNAVAAKHEYNWASGCKHVFSANGTVAVRDTLDALVRIFDSHRHTSTTGLVQSQLNTHRRSLKRANLAVEEVFSQTTTFPTYTAIITVIYAFI
jgi:hypothetical protein